MSDYAGFTASLVLRPEDVESADVSMNRYSRPFPTVRLGHLTVLAGADYDLAAILRGLAVEVDRVRSAAASSCIWEGDPEHDRCASCTAGFPEDCDRYPAAADTIKEAV
jgi:hypothetical protein